MLPALSALSIFVLVYAVVIAWGAFRLIRGVPLVSRLNPKARSSFPRVSVIVPACNEEDSLEQAMRSRLCEEYPDAEYILIDDRSTDRTGAIVDQLAKEDARVIPLHVRELPRGWLGKVHAMQRGLERATGEWILFSDADIHHEPGALARIVAHCEETGIDHVAVVPQVWSSTFWLDVMMNSLFRIMMIISRAWKVPDPKSRISIGGGNFNLVRRTTLERAGGLSPLKLEVVDDAALGQVIKHAGGRAAVFNACDSGESGLVGLYYYRTVGEAIRGMEKNCFAVIGRFSILRFVLSLMLLAVVELGPYLVIAIGNGYWRVIGAIAVLTLLGAQMAVTRWMRRPALPTVFAPIGILLMLVGAVRSMMMTIGHDGVAWRGTHYSLAELRAGMRLRLL